MTRINLLPWRELRRKQVSMQILRGSIFTWALVALIVFYGNLHFNGLIDDQNKRNKYLQDQITKLEKEIKDINKIKDKKQALIARMEVIQKLQRDRTQIVHVFDDLVKKLPEGMYIQAFKREGNNITLNGVAQSNARISTLMRNLDSSEWFSNPSLEVINVGTERGETERLHKFILRVVQAGKKQEQE
jgi:type IV pilus assembly protein PilN